MQTDCDLDRKKFLKALDEIEQELKQTPHTLSGLALMELNKLKLRNHKDHEILKSFHGLNDILIATLIAYYWDIERFKDVDSFIGYMVMGANPEVSGTSLNRMKTDKARAEVKGKFFMLFLQSHKDNSPYKPIIDLLRSRLGGGNNQKKRYIKFLTDLLELVYYALKYRLSFDQAVAWKVKQLEREKARLRNQLEKAREQGNQEKASLLGWEHENITLNKQAWELVLSKVGSIFQIVYEPEMEEFIELLIPYIKGYLDESAPVLEARTYMDLLKEQSIMDPLTGLSNRRFLEEPINTITAQTKRRNTKLGILAIDVDYFKQVNDVYGHDAGDKVLVEVAKTIKSSIRESDIAVRYGGEEFLVLLMDVQPGYSVHVAEKIRTAVEGKVIDVGTAELKKTVSIGVSEFPVDSDKIWQCIKFADVALYRAKEEGRNRVVRFTEDMWTKAEY